MGVDTPRIVLVGHCGPDAYVLTSAVGRAVKGASVEFVNDEDGAVRAAEGAALVLVNRALDGDFASGDGVELISKLTGKAKVMLVSNFPDAQQAAEKAGALPGFGKTMLYGEETARRIRGAVS